MVHIHTLAQSPSIGRDFRGTSSQRDRLNIFRSNNLPQTLRVAFSVPERSTHVMAAQALGSMYGTNKHTVHRLKPHLDSSESTLQHSDGTSSRQNGCGCGCWGGAQVSCRLNISCVYHDAR